MTKVLISLIVLFSFVVPTYAADITAPEVPGSGADIMPQNTDSFLVALQTLFQNSKKLIGPAFQNAVQTCTGMLFVMLLCSILPILTDKIHTTISIGGTVAIAAGMFQRTNVMIAYAVETVREICEYGKLLCPVMTMALAAQGGVTSSAALYTGTTAIVSVLSMLISRVCIPLVYIFLLFSVSYSAFGQEIMKAFTDGIKRLLSWFLKTFLIAFTTFMGITGIVGGTTDAAALKATKVTISSVVPVVGGILSDASESVLLGMGVIKNAVGVYGILAVLAVFMGPFIKVGAQYLLLKLTAGICVIFDNKGMSALADDFSSAMGLLLGMVASCCLLVLISTVCYMKGIV